MDSESESLPWIANLPHKFNTLCAEAEAVIYQEPIEYVRNQYLVASECLKELYTELVEDTLPTFVWGLMKKSASSSLKQEEHTDLSPHSISEGKSTANYSSPLPPPEKTSDIYDHCSTKEKGDESPKMETSDYLANSSEQDKKSNEVEEYILPDYNNTSISASASAKDRDSFVLEWGQLTSYAPHFIILLEAPENYSAESLQEFDKSLIAVESEDLCSDADVETDGLSYQKKRKKKRFAKKQSCQSASQVIDEVKDANEWEEFDEDFSDSDWEFV